MRVVRIGLVAAVSLLAVGVVLLMVLATWWWAFAAVPLVLLAAVGVYDVTQRQHAVLRNYPVLGHLRYLMETIRPELQQYFIERNFDGRPFDREVRSLVYQRAKNTTAEDPFGTERDVYASGYEFFQHSTAPCELPEQLPRVPVGGAADDARGTGESSLGRYSMALLNVSAMSFGSLSANAIQALNSGAEMGGFAHDTGEGAISEHHKRFGGDLVWEIGTGYFGCRTADGGFDAEEFGRKAAWDQVKCVSLKLSQGAKPGTGGVLPGSKVNAEIAAVREVPQGKTVVSPAYHQVFSTPRELVQFLARMRELAGGKPTGCKLCVGSRRELLAICKAMLEENHTPDFIIVDGAEGGTGAAPLEYADHIGTPLTEGLITMHNALVGTGLRHRIRLGASGKVATGADLVKRLIQGADYTNAARAMMFAVGCIQAQSCHTNRCPVGVATQDPRRANALDVTDKSHRVRNYQQATVASAVKIMASMGVRDPSQLRPEMLLRRVSPTQVRSYAELYEWLAPGELLEHPPEGWRIDWERADPDSFATAADGAPRAPAALR